MGEEPVLKEINKGERQCLVSEGREPGVARPVSVQVDGASVAFPQPCHSPWHSPDGSYGPGSGLGDMRREKGSVLLVGNFLSESLVGSRGVCEDLAVRLAAAGWLVLTASSHPGRLSRLMDMVRTVWRRRHEYGAAHVDVYSGAAWGWAEAVCWTLRRAGKPYVLTLRGGGLPSFAARWPHRVAKLLGSAAAVTTPSPYLLAHLGHYRRDLQLIPNPLNLASYVFRERTRPRPRLVWMRAFHRIYNPSLAPKVVAALAPRFSEVHLSMAGPDKGDGSLQAMRASAARLGVTDRIAANGGVPKAEVGQWLQRGDIFLNTTNVDNTPVSVLEAMACGLCVVSTAVGGIPYLLQHEHDALLVPPDNPAAMAAAVSDILAQPGLARRLSRNARRKAERLDWSAVLREWMLLFTRVRSATVR